MHDNTSLYMCPVHQVLRFLPTVFDVAFSMGCKSDRLRYYNGHDVTRSKFIDFCGDAVPFMPVSGDNVAIFKLFTLDRLERKGFEMIYNTTPMSDQLSEQSRVTFGKSLSKIQKLNRIYTLILALI